MPFLLPLRSRFLPRSSHLGLRGQIRHFTGLFASAVSSKDKVAIVDPDGQFTYRSLLSDSHRLSKKISDQLQLAAEKKPKNHQQASVAFLFPRKYPYVVAQWACWRAGAIAVPLCETHPIGELDYVVKDSKASVVIAHPQFAGLASQLAKENHVPLITLDSSQLKSVGKEEEILAAPKDQSENGAMLIYTSGTTGKPKGVLLTHSNLDAMIMSLVKAWGWSPSDRILHVLPLHHVHGVVAVLLCALRTGATCEFMPKFDAHQVLPALTRNPRAADAISVFMAVPTVYSLLIKAFEEKSIEEQKSLTATFTSPSSPLRLMVSGSAALPPSVAGRWKEITGHSLLERYGMSEFGMAISNPLAGERRLASVGRPLPGYEAMLVNETTREPIKAEGISGELLMRGKRRGSARKKKRRRNNPIIFFLLPTGPAVFREYYGREKATEEAFEEIGGQKWFRTGDVCVIKDGYYYIQGRMSVDIIKCGGHKISALEIEQALLEHPKISEAVVVGVADPAFGQQVVAVIVERSQTTNQELREFALSLLAKEKAPTVFHRVKGVPKNAMGKVNKKTLLKDLGIVS